jgi:hypothetical protein
MMMDFTNDLSNIRDNIIDCSIVSAAFWLSSHAIQRIYGSLPSVTRIHAGKGLAVTTITGIISTAASLAFSNRILAEVRPKAQNKFLYFPEFRKEQRDRRLLVKRIMAGFLFFGFLEHRMFRTMLPSSILTTGVFANPYLSEKYSVKVMSSL